MPSECWLFMRWTSSCWASIENLSRTRSVTPFIGLHPVICGTWMHSLLAIILVANVSGTISMGSDSLFMVEPT
jgi:hypothetical protein